MSQCIRKTRPADEKPTAVVHIDDDELKGQPPAPVQEKPMQEKNVYGKKKLGRPPGSQYAGAIPVRLSLEIRDLVDQYAKDAEVSRSEAIRDLLETGLWSAGRIRER